MRLLTSAASAVAARAAGSGARSRFAFAFDMDGVLVHGKKAIEGAAEAVTMLRERGVPYILLTNSGAVLEETRAGLLNRILGERKLFSSQNVILAHTPMRALVERYRDDVVLVAGPRQVKAVALAYGFRRPVTVNEFGSLHVDMHHSLGFYRLEDVEPVPDYVSASDSVRAVMVLNDPVHWAQDLQIIVDVLRSNGKPHDASVYAPHLGTHDSTVPLYTACSDLVYKHNFHAPRLGLDAFTRSLLHLYDSIGGGHVDVRRYGKPYEVTYRFAERMLTALNDGVMPERVYMVGDNPASDIAGALRAGGPWRGVLTRTGVFSGPGNDAEHPAHYVYDDVRAAVGDLLAQESA